MVRAYANERVERIIRGDLEVQVAADSYTDRVAGGIEGHHRGVDFPPITDEDPIEALGLRYIL